MEDLNEYELEVLKRLENKFSMDPEQTSPYKNYVLLLKQKLYGTYIMSYYNEKLHHDIFPIPEKYKNSYILLYSEKNRYEFLFNALMTFWQNEIDNLLSLLLQREIEILQIEKKSNIPQNLEMFIQSYIQESNPIFENTILEEELKTFGISILKDLIEISYSWNSTAYFINKHLFYEILLFYFESLKRSKFLSHFHFIDKNIKILNDWIQIIKN